MATARARLLVYSGWSVASGVAYGLTFPTASLQWLAWIALAPFFVALRRVGTRAALVLGWLWTVTAAYTLGDWFAGSIARYYGQPLAVGIGFFFGVSSLLAAPYYMAFALAYRRIATPARAATPVLAAAAWTAAELARGNLLAGNPWALFGYSQVGRDTLVQIADMTGIYGVSFVLVAVNAALAELWLAPTDQRRRALTGLAAAAGLTAATLAYGVLRPPRLSPASGPPVPVAMVQGNLDLGTQWREDFYGRNLDTYLRLTSEVLREHRPALVVWPENALSFFLEDEPVYRRAIGHVLAPTATQLLAGGPRTDGAASPAYYNSMFLLDADGTILGRYDKQRLVPFGEYFPLAFIESLQRRFGRVRNFTPGATVLPFATTAGHAGITICSEAMFPEIAAARVAAGADFFVDPAHDTWLTPKFSAQQFDIVRMRTVEQRRWLVRASTSGPSAIVDPAGRVVTRTSFFAQAAIAGTIEPRHDVTWYGRLGDVFGWGCIVATLVGLRRRRTATSCRAVASSSAAPGT